MAVTLDFSTAVPIDQPKSVTLDMSTAIPLPQASQPKQEALGGIGTPASGPLGALLRNFTKSATAGQSEPAAAGLSALAEKPLQAAGLVGKRGFGEAAADYSDKQKKSLEKLNQENPVSAKVGEIAGYVSPGGAFSLAEDAAKAGLERAAPLMEKIPQGLRGLLGSAATGGAANAGYQAVNPDNQNSVGENFAVGAIAKPVAEGVGAGVSKLAELAPTIPSRLMGMAKRIPVLGGAIEAGQEIEAQKAAQAAAQRLESSTEAIKELPKNDIITSGNNLSAAAKKAFSTINDNYKQVVSPISEKYGHLPADPSSLLNQIDEVMRGEDVLDAKGNISQNEIKDAPKQQTKEMLTYLSSLKSKLLGETEEEIPYDLATGQKIQNPLQISKLSKIVSKLQKEANFKGVIRTPEEAIYGKLSYAAKDALHNSLSQFANPEEMQNLVTAKQIYSSTRPIVEDLLKATNDKFPEQIVKSAGSQLPQSLAKDVISKAPEAGPALGDVVLNHIVGKATSPKAFTKAIDTYGRDTLQNLLGDEAFSSLEAAEKQFSTAKMGLQKPQGVLSKIIKKTFSPSSYPSAFSRIPGAIAPTIQGASQ